VLVLLKVLVKVTLTDNSNEFVHEGRIMRLLGKYILESKSKSNHKEFIKMQFFDYFYELNACMHNAYA
jgi:hypothetical protein